MKILQINTVCGKSGSVGRITADLYRYIRQNDMQAYVAYSRGRAYNIQIEDGIKIGSTFTNYLDGFLSRIFDCCGFNSRIATLNLIKKIDSVNPDIIHLHNLHGYYINVKILFKYIKKSGIKVVWTLHDCWPFTGHCCYFDYAKCDKWTYGCENCKEKASYPKSYLDFSKRNYAKKKSVFTSIDKDKLVFVTPSKWLKGVVENSFLKDYRVEVIENGINSSDFTYAESSIKSELGILGKKVILGVANKWDRRKGLRDLTALLSRLGDGYRLIAVGVDEEQKSSLPKNAIGISSTNSVKELAQFYSIADVFVNPTYEDNYPTTNMEAQSCGCPVVTYKTGGSGENVIEGFGFTVEKGDIGALEECVKKIVNDGLDRAELKRRAEIFNKENTLKKYIELYKNL